MLRSYLFLVSGLILFVQCARKQVPVASDNRSKTDTIASGDHAQPKPDEKPRRRPFKNVWKADVVALHDSLVKNLASQPDTFLTAIYSQNDFKPYWTDTKRVKELISTIDSVVIDGLSPEDYGAHKLDSLLKKVTNLREASGNSATSLELACTKTYIHYVHDMVLGKVDPDKLFKEWNYEKRSDPLFTAENISNYMSQSLEKSSEEMRPTFPVYGLLKKALKTMDSLDRERLVWLPVVYQGKKNLKLGDTNAVIIEVKRRLHNIGSYPDTSLTNEFNEQLQESLKAFQELLALPVTGQLDKATIKQLNFTLKQAKDQIRVNMERCRWLDAKLPEKYIQVNITDYKLVLVEKGKVIHTARVVVGKEQRQTPVFATKMTGIEMNPYWVVPRGIAVGEILPDILKDPNYLTRNRMQILTPDGTPVDPSGINFASLNKNNFPYMVRQLPGEKNSLGVIKFGLVNPYAIYLHDTPAKHIFDYPQRAYSHGCVRVQYPLDLAAILLKDQGFTKARLEQFVAEGRNYNIAMEKSLPVYITYWTCYTDIKTGKLQFYRDVYGKDARVLKELNKHKGTF